MSNAPDSAPQGLSVFGVQGLPEIVTGDPIGELISRATTLQNNDVVVVTQKIVSKAEGRVVEVNDASDTAKRELAESEAVRVLRRRGDLVITETRHGFICANSGVDLSNIEAGYAVLLPRDPDRSARRIKDAIKLHAGVEVGVIVSDTFGRPWRKGLTDVAIGCAGVAAVVDLRGHLDGSGRVLAVTEICIADEIAGAAELVMGKSGGIPVAVIRGIDPAMFRESSVRQEIIRPPHEDLFR